MIKHLAIAFLVLSVVGCKDDQMVSDEGIDLTHIEYQPESYEIKTPPRFPMMEIPEDNPLTIDGVELGRFLFFDPILSADSTMSCGTCHDPAGAYTDNLATSTGIDGINGKRSSMSLLNIGYNYNGLFWDGRIKTLEEQALLPVEDEIELHHEWIHVIEDLQASALYREMFRRAFGITNSKDITKELAAKALASFERSLVSSGRSKYDRVQLFETSLSPEEQEGHDLYFDEDIPGLPDGQCFHCHNAPLMTTNQYFNNGLDDVPSLDDFRDFGRFLVTDNHFDKGKFRAPTLRNIQYTAPYMHDGRFETLEEVLEMYNSGGHGVLNEDENLSEPLGLTQDHINNLLLFIETLRDTAFINDPRYQNPFN